MKRNTMNNLYNVKKVIKPHDFKTTVPGSKSITNRALLIAALAQGKSVLHGVLFSDDSRHFIQALIDLGFSIQVSEKEKTVEIEGMGGKIPCVEKQKNKDEIATDIYVGSAGTAARFLTVFLALSKGKFRLNSSEQMKKRPMKELLLALESIGATIIYEEQPYEFPFVLDDFKWNGKSVSVDVEKSSQFLSAFLISSVLLPKELKIYPVGQHGMNYVYLTCKMMKQFGVEVEERENYFCLCDEHGYEAKEYDIEPDLSAAAYFYAICPLLGIQVLVHNVHMNSMQGDIHFLEVLEKMGCHIDETEEGILLSPPEHELLGGDFDLSAFSDQALTLAAISAFASTRVCIKNVGHIRYQECDRIEAILHNLKSMGIVASCEEGNISILPGIPKATSIETFEDHRVAMAFTLPGLLVDGFQIKNPACTKKTFENYFDVLEQAVY